MDFSPYSVFRQTDCGLPETDKHGTVDLRWGREEERVAGRWHLVGYRCEHDSVVSLWASSTCFSVVPCISVACTLSLIGLTPPLWPPQFLASGKFLGYFLQAIIFQKVLFST